MGGAVHIRLLTVIFLLYFCPLALAAQVADSAYTQCRADITKFNGLFEGIHVFVQELDDSDHEPTVPEVRTQLKADIQEAWLLLEKIQDFLCQSDIVALMSRCRDFANYCELARLLGVESTWFPDSMMHLEERRAVLFVRADIDGHIQDLFGELDGYRRRLGMADIDLPKKLAQARMLRNKLAKDVVNHIIIPGALWCFTGLVHVALIVSCWWG